MIKKIKAYINNWCMRKAMQHISETYKGEVLNDKLSLAILVYTTQKVYDLKIGKIGLADFANSVTLIASKYAHDRYNKRRADRN